MSAERISARESRQVELNFRNMRVRTSSIDLANRSIEMRLTTETPVRMFDYERWEFVDEILLTAGAELPESRQIPLLDSHQRFSTDTQLGSIRELAKGPDGVIGRAFFSSTAEDSWTKVREGHITDVSAGYQVIDKEYIGRGDKKKIAGRTFEGPVNVATKWRVREGSITPIGADEQAKLRGLDLNGPRPQTTLPNQKSSTHQKRFAMSAELKAFLVRCGMPAETSDADAQAWMCAPENVRKLAEAQTAPGTTPQPGSQPAAGVGITAGEFKRMLDESNASAAKVAGDAALAVIEARDKRVEAHRTEVRALCELADLPDEFERAVQLQAPDKIREHLANAKKERQQKLPADFTLSFGPAARDVQRTAMSQALLLRGIRSSGLDGEKLEKALERAVPAAERSKEIHHFDNLRLFNLAEHCCRMDGFDIRGRSRQDIAIIALGFGRQIGARAASDVAYNTTANFPSITKDAMNKSMMVGYQEFPATWNRVFRQGESAPDFKQIHRIQLGATPNLPAWVAGKDPERGSFADGEEHYAVEAKSIEINFNWQLVVNDDLSALSRVPFMLGNSASRTVNALAWQQITANNTLRDGVALFSTATGARKRSNLQSGLGNPSVTALATVFPAMRNMRGENTPEGNEGPDILNLEPKFLVGPAELEIAIDQLVDSQFDPASNKFQVFNPGRRLEGIVEPLLGVNSTAAWYVFADKSQIDTVEVTFLQGQETPQARSWEDPRSLSMVWIMMQTFGAAPLNHRGMQKISS